MVDYGSVAEWSQVCCSGACCCIEGGNEADGTGDNTGNKEFVVIHGSTILAVRIYFAVWGVANGSRSSFIGS